MESKGADTAIHIHVCKWNYTALMFCIFLPQSSADAAVFCRGMRGDQARKVCPEVQLVQVPTAHGKADLTMYRDAGKKVHMLSFWIV